MVSLWEIALKVRIGKLEADTKEIANIIQRDGFTLLDMSLKHILALRELPIHHRDPFDHLLMAQAITEDATFLSEDRNAARYPVRTVGCSG
jgi:PIN domain nuclease of toxin-antitoxin system